MALVVLLRGINVGGHRAFRPTTLAAQLDAVNLGAAGTFVIRRPITRARLRAEIARRLPFAAEIVICSGRDLLDLLAQDPFAHHPARPDLVRFVSVLSRRPRATPPTPTRLPPRGRWLVEILGHHDRFVVGVHRREMKAIGQLGALDALFGATATTRSWSTIAAIGRVLETRQ